MWCAHNTHKLALKIEIHGGDDSKIKSAHQPYNKQMRALREALLREHEYVWPVVYKCLEFM